MGDVRLLALAPRRLGRRVGVGARLDDARDGLAELSPDALQGRWSALILDGVVQQRGNRLIFGSAVLDDERRQAEQVPKVGDVRALAQLLARWPGHEEVVAALQRAWELFLGGEAPGPAVIAQIGEGWVAEEALAIARVCCWRSTMRGTPTAPGRSRGSGSARFRANG